MILWFLTSIYNPIEVFCTISWLAYKSLLKVYSLYFVANIFILNDSSMFSLPFSVSGWTSLITSNCQTFHKHTFMLTSIINFHFLSVLNYKIVNFPKFRSVTYTTIVIAVFFPSAVISYSNIRLIYLISSFVCNYLPIACFTCVQCKHSSCPVLLCLREK